jgi:hypothetical protein
MSDKKISELTLVTNNASGDVFPMVQGSANFKTTLAKIATFLQGFLPASETAKGFVELATNAEVQTGTDTERAVTPAGLQSKVASETAKGFVELATQAETDTGTNDTTAVTPLKLKTSSQWATKITKLNIANTASGNDSVTINAESGIATFTRPITHNDAHNFTINNNTISATDVVVTKLSYNGAGYPAILHCTCTANTITIHMANLKVGGGSDSTNANLVVSFFKVN